MSDENFRFWDKVRKAGPDDCWEWWGSLTRGGYGQLWVQSEERPVRAHRLSWEIHNGPIPEGLYVCHK